MSISLKVYSGITTLLAPLVGAAFSLHERGKIRLKERFGRWEELPSEFVWFHGASKGEISGLLPLIKEFSKAFGNEQKILVSSTSPTGLDFEIPGIIKKLLPFDSTLFIEKALGNSKPKLFLATETELWPSLLYVLRNIGTECVLINGRISDATIGRYKILKNFFGPLLDVFKVICVVDEEAKTRFEALGIESLKIFVTGNTKYDKAPSVDSLEEKAAILSHYYPNSEHNIPLIVLGSVRPEEERFWLDEYCKLNTSVKRLRLVLVPRHLEKLSYFEENLKQRKIRFTKFSQIVNASQSEDVILVDQMGELERLYSVANLAFIGATLVNVGGHNPLEAAAYKTPVVVGPYTGNVREIVKDLISVGGVTVVETQDQICNIMERVIARDSSLVEMGTAAEKVAEKHRGATLRVVNILREQLQNIGQS